MSSEGSAEAGSGGTHKPCEPISSDLLPDQIRNLAYLCGAGDVQHDGPDAALGRFLQASSINFSPHSCEHAKAERIEPQGAAAPDATRCACNQHGGATGRASVASRQSWHV